MLILDKYKIQSFLSYSNCVNVGFNKTNKNINIKNIYSVSYDFNKFNKNLRSYIYLFYIFFVYNFFNIFFLRLKFKKVLKINFNNLLFTNYNYIKNLYNSKY